MEDPPTLQGNIPRHQETNTILRERYHGRVYLSHYCKYGSYVLRQVGYRGAMPFVHVCFCTDNGSLLPAIAYTLDMYRRTGEFFGVNESLFSSAMAAIVFSVLGAQPLTIVGVTGLISLFNFTIYDIVQIYDGSIYPEFMAWTGIWAAIFHWLVAIFNVCDYMRYVTDFSSESFGLYVGIIYLSKSASVRL